MIGVLDYGVGNVRAFLTVYHRLNIPAQAVSTPAEMGHADRLILPGVGAFDWAMERLNQSGLRPALDEAALGQGKPVLGVCVGMQMMARASTEGKLPGLGWLAGEVVRFADSYEGRAAQLPHMGWNDVTPRTDARLFEGLGDPRFYFLHSYYWQADDAADVAATCDYLGPFACAVARRAMFGVQFHPEKSHGFGLRLLQNFAYA